ncbi:MAG: hypothetical protein HOG03_23520 [Desulfobacula sp.]|nr:hypothetical protein [Desulfobacula sp.]MBT4027613.1 hypothetical protein [Desulfobacula sp.]
MNIKVNCYSGYRGEETPRSIFFNDKEIQVNKILDMWLAPDHRYFKFLGSDESIYIIRHDTKGCFWELTFYKGNPDL